MFSFLHRKPVHRTTKFRFPEMCRKLTSSLFVTALCFLSFGCAGNTPLNNNTSSARPAGFSNYLDDFFREYVTSDSLSLHYTVQNPDTLGIEKPTVSLGHFGTDTLLASNRTATEQLSKLRTFSRDTLEPEDRLTYDLLEYALETSVFPEQAVLYDSPLGPTTGLQTQLPILLAEYRFSSLEDVEDYFLLLEDLPNYFSELCTFEQARSEAGTQACAEVLSRILLQCNSFVEDPGNNFLIESFKDRISTLPDLEATKVAELCMQNQKLVFTKVIPAYEHLIETLKGLIDTSVPAVGLAAFPEGSAYYEYLVRNNTGSDKSIKELETMLQKALTENMLTMITLYESEALRNELKEYQKSGLSLSAESKESLTTGDSAAEATLSASEYSSSVLQQLQMQICSDFPTPADASFRVQTVHPSLEDFISPALYLVPPLDSYTENVIYINQEKCSVESLYSTLAHEGYPGHLYQNTYFAATRPHPVRMLLNFTGYDEGWGTYAELYSYRYADCSEELRQFLIAEQVAGLCLYSLSDIRIHYYGDDLEKIVIFLKKYGFSSESAEEIFYTLLAEPAIYLPYSVGYLEFCSLRDLYRTIEGTDASLLPFHAFLLETGPAPFPTLEALLVTKFR